MGCIDHPSVELAIPRDVAPGRGWTPQMIEMAVHIGAYETLMLSDKVGGRTFYIPEDATRNPFIELIGPDKAAVVSWIYRRETIVIPTAQHALRLARRAPVLAAVRSGDLTVSAAARIIGTRRNYVSHLVNHSAEGTGSCPLPPPRRRVDDRQLDMFGEP